MDASKRSLCGEESFRTSSDHSCENDGPWAVLAWFSILATCKQSMEDILKDHLQIDFGAGTSSPGMMTRRWKPRVQTKWWRTWRSWFLITSSVGDRVYTGEKTDNSEYSYPTDESVSRNQSLRLISGDGSPIIFWLSDSGSVGTTIWLWYGQLWEGPRGLY